MLAIVDADTFGYCYENYNSANEIISNLDNWIYKIHNNTNATEYLMFLTSCRDSFRYKIHPGYKGNRLKNKPPKWKGFVKEYLKSNYNAVELFDIEADDACAIHHRYYPDSIICSIDSDFSTIECKLYNFKKHKHLIINKEDAEYNFWKYVMIGQAKDGIPVSHKGFGAAKAEKFLANYSGNSIPISTLVQDMFVNGCTKAECGKDFIVDDNIITKAYQADCFDKNVRLMKILENEEMCKAENVNYRIYETNKVKNYSSSPFQDVNIKNEYS